MTSCDLPVRDIAAKARLPIEAFNARWSGRAYMSSLSKLIKIEERFAHDYAIQLTRGDSSS